MNEHEAMVERVAKALTPGKWLHVPTQTICSANEIAHATLDAILDGNTLIVGGGPGGLVRGEQSNVFSLIGATTHQVWWLTPITATDPARG